MRVEARLPYLVSRSLSLSGVLGPALSSTTFAPFLLQLELDLSLSRLNLALLLIHWKLQVFGAKDLPQCPRPTAVLTSTDLPALQLPRYFESFFGCIFLLTWQICLALTCRTLNRSCFVTGIPTVCISTGLTSLLAKKASVPLGPFDGRVATVHPSLPEWYISSPNCEYIPLPPGPRCNVYPRLDGRFGADDHTQWPQPFSEKFPHLSCIPKKTEGHQHSVIWQDPIKGDFKRLRHNGENIDLGKWSEWWLQSLSTSSKWLLDEVARRQTSSKALDSHSEIAPLSIHLGRALSRLRAVSMTYRGAIISLRLVQRLWLELHGLMEYVDRYLPFMEGRAPPTEQLADVIGCFVHTAHVAERLFAAGIPYWAIRPLRTFDTENILSIDTIVKPDYLLVVEDHAAYAPRIYQGESNNNRYLAICNFSLKYMHYANPFIGDLRTGISPYEFSQTKSLTGPSRAGPPRTHATSVRPCTSTLLIMVDVS